MILSLLGVGFLLFANASKCTSVNVVDSNNIVDIDFQPRLNQPYDIYNEQGIRGLYNFYDVFDFDYFSSDLYFEFEPTGYEHLVPFVNEYNLVGFIRSIGFECLGDYPIVDTIEVYITYYPYSLDDTAQDYTSYFELDNGSNVSSIGGGWNSLIFNVQSTYYASHEGAYNVFNEVFTHGDNRYVTSYNGYYTFNSNPSFVNGYQDTVFGAISINNNLYTYMTLAENESINSAVFQFGYFDYLNNKFTTENISFKSATNWVLGVNNIYFNNCKMSQISFNRLATLGIFGYQHDSSLDNITFHDFLFTLMDVPVYFITQFFNFELFGMNLAIAFAGLVTLAVMLCVVRIIMRLF